MVDPGQRTPPPPRFLLNLFLKGEPPPPIDFLIFSSRAPLKNRRGPGQLRSSHCEARDAPCETRGFAVSRASQRQRSSAARRRKGGRRRRGAWRSPGEDFPFSGVASPGEGVRPKRRWDARDAAREEGELVCRWLSLRLVY